MCGGWIRPHTKDLRGAGRRWWGVGGDTHSPASKFTLCFCRPKTEIMSIERCENYSKAFCDLSIDVRSFLFEFLDVISICSLKRTSKFVKAFIEESLTHCRRVFDGQKGFARILSFTHSFPAMSRLLFTICFAVFHG